MTVQLGIWDCILVQHQLQLENKLIPGKKAANFLQARKIGTAPQEAAVGWQIQRPDAQSHHGLLAPVLLADDYAVSYTFRFGVVVPELRGEIGIASCRERV